MADLGGNGSRDLAATSFDRDVAVLLNNGDGI
jgi:hypothetical protein